MAVSEIRQATVKRKTSETDIGRTWLGPAK